MRLPKPQRLKARESGGCSSRAPRPPLRPIRPSQRTKFDSTDTFQQHTRVQERETWHSDLYVSIIMEIDASILGA